MKEGNRLLSAFEPRRTQGTARGRRKRGSWWGKSERATREEHKVKVARAEALRIDGFWPQRLNTTEKKKWPITA